MAEIFFSAKQKVMMKIETGEQNKTLRTKCKEVKTFDESLQKIVEEMAQTMLEPTAEGVKGVGLAANQVGLDIRVLLITLNMDKKKNHKILPMINPEIIELSPQKVEMEEGCLSLPNTYENVMRPAKVKVRWQNLEGTWCEKKLEKWDARIFLHEYDHLEGVLFTDYLPKRKNCSKK